MQEEIKRGYVKWTDKDGVRHKVPVDEYFEEKKDDEVDPIYPDEQP